MIGPILIVDDSRTARALFKACISGLGDYEILETGNWQEAVQLAKDRKPKLCVLDYNMPEKVGTEIAKEIINTGIDTTFVLMTANTQDSVVQEAKSLGFIDVLEKPVSASVLALLLEKV